MCRCHGPPKAGILSIERWERRLDPDRVKCLAEEIKVELLLEREVPVE